MLILNIVRNMNSCRRLTGALKQKELRRKNERKISLTDVTAHNVYGR